MMTANRFFVPNTEEFFEGLVVLLPQCGLCCQENSDVGLAEFLARRLEGYQHTLGDIWSSSFSRDSTHSRYGMFDPSNWYTIGIPGKPVQ